MDKRWLVISHERSGTEWLIASLIKNLFPDLYQPNNTQQARWDMDDRMLCDPKVMTEFLFERDDLRTKLIFGVKGTTSVKGTDHRVPVKSHHAFDFFEPIWDRVLEEFNVIYIMRDGRDVMTSMWRHGWNHEGFMPRAFNVRRFIAMEPTEGMGRYHGDYPVNNMAERWNNHLLNWYDRKGVIYISYEQLSFRYKETIRAIAMLCDLPIPTEVENPGMTGVRPWKGQVSNWTKYISKQDLGYFRTVAWPGMKMVREHNYKVELDERGWTDDG
jgi:hypothetical protein